MVLPTLCMDGGQMKELMEKCDSNHDWKDLKEEKEGGCVPPTYLSKSQLLPDPQIGGERGMDARRKNLF